MLEQLRLRTRIFAAFALMAAFSIGAGLLNLWSVQRLGGSLDGIVQRSLPILRASLEADMAHDCVRASVFRALLGGMASRKVSQSLVEIEATSRSIEQVFNGIVGQIRSLDDLVGEIAAASKEQSQGVAEVNMAVSQIDRVTQSNAALAEENSSASEELNAQSRSVNGIVSALRDMVRGAGTGREQAQSLRESRRVGSHTGSGRGQSTVQTNDGAGSVVASQDGDIPMPGHSGAGQTSSRDF